MNKNFVIAAGLIGLLVAGVAAYQLNNKTQVEPASTTAESAPMAEPAAEQAENTKIDFALPDLDGNMHQLSDWDGKARLVNFWATWCAPCRREIPLLMKTQEAHADENIQIIGIAVDFVDQVTAYAQETQFNYPILVGQEDAMAAAEASGVSFIGMPFTMVITPSGELIKTHIGEILEEHIDSILAVFADLETGKIDTDGARAALKTL